MTCTIASGATAASTWFTIYVTASTSASTAGISNAATLTDPSDTIAAGSAGDLTPTATDTIQNTSGATINNPYAEISALSQGNTLISQSADVTSVAPGANVTFTFHIQLASCGTFRLIFDVYGN